LRLPAPPSSATVAGVPVDERSDLDAEGYFVRLLPSGEAVVRLRHAARGPVVVLMNAAGCSIPPDEPR
jgi:hypothetical protein